MKVLVCGGRDYADSEFLNDCLDRVHAKRGITQVIHGGATGADRLAGAWAASRGVAVAVFMADWDGFGRAAGPMRNKKMLEQKPDVVVAFAGGRGTSDMIKQASSAGVTVWAPRQSGWPA